MLMTRSASLACLIACFAVVARNLEAQAPDSAEAASLISREALFGNPERSQGRISPDGSFLSWLAPHEGVMNVWVAPSDDPGAARVITHDALRGVAYHEWAPDSRHVFYLQDQGGDENFHVHSANVTTAQVLDLTPVRAGVRASLEGVSSLRPDVVIVGLNDRDPELFDLYEVDYRSGKRRLIARNPGFGGWYLDRMLRPRLAFEQRPGGGGTYFHVGRDGTKGRPFLEISTDDFVASFMLGFNEHGDTVYATDSRGRDKTVILAMDLATGGSRVVAASDEADVGGYLLHPTTGRPLAYSVEYLTTRWHAIDSAVAPDIAFLNQRLPGTLFLVSATADNGQWVVAHETAESPTRYHLYDRASRTLSLLFLTRPSLDREPLQPMHPLVIRSRDGLDLVSYLTLPRGRDADADGRPEAPLPIVLMVHGGPWGRDSYGYNPEHQWLANRGYGVLSVNFRGSTGFGKDHVNKAIGEWSGKMHDDLIDAVDWAVREEITHADSVAIYGGSYGGYATLVGLTFTPDRFACGVDIVGPSNLVTLMESFPPYWRPFIESTFYRHIGDPTNPEDRKRLTAQSPLTRAAQIRAPLLIGQGGNDPRVKRAEADQIVGAMQANDLPVTYINYPDEGHGFQRPANRLSFYAAMEGFLGECLGGRAEPIGNAFVGSSAEIIAGGDLVPGLGAVAGARGQLRKSAE
jgi:dipeptidyl aminopeptidase/acylaminoacyl peptidase